MELLKLLATVPLLFSLLNYQCVCEGAAEGNSTTITFCPINDTDPFCTCHEEVISCDFSSLNPVGKHSVTFLPGWGDEDSSQDLWLKSVAQIKRICFCHGSKNVEIFLPPFHDYMMENLHRADFENLMGTLHLHSAFADFFSGDVYMSRVHINTIHSYDFARGSSRPIEDVTGLSCCAKFQTPKGLQSPVLYIEKSSIGLIKSHGIDSTHMWRTIIIKNVKFEVIERTGIALSSGGTNISITESEFLWMNETALAFNNQQNLLMSRNIFGQDCHPLAFGAVSSYPHSTIILFENDFKNKIFMKLDAQNVLVWFNHFDSWDRDTFPGLSTTKNNGRTLSLAFNTVTNITSLGSSDLAIPGKNVMLKDNVLSYCNCSSVCQLTLPSLLKNSRCEALVGDKSKNSCHLQLDKVLKDCQRQGSPVTEMLCTAGEILPVVKVSDIEQLQGILKEESIAINLNFYSKLIFSSPYSYSSTQLSDGDMTKLPTGDKKQKNEGKLISSLGESLVPRKIFLCFSLYFVCTLIL